MLSDDEIDEIRSQDPGFNRNFRIQFELSRASYTLQALKLAFEQLKVQYGFTLFRLRSEWNSTGLSSASTAEQTPAKYMRDSFLKLRKRNVIPTRKEYSKNRMYFQFLIRMV